MTRSLPIEFDSTETDVGCVYTLRVGREVVAEVVSEEPLSTRRSLGMLLEAVQHNG